MLRKIIQSIVYSLESIVKELFLCLLSAGLLIFSFPNFNLWILAGFGFVPLFFAIRNKPKAKAFLLAYFTGIIFWLGIIYWLAHVTLLGMILLVLYLALYFGIFGLIISTIDYRLSTIDLISIPSLWVLLEYIRSHLLTGFPWALLGYSQYLNLSVIQIADITGVWGVSFLVMMINVAVYICAARCTLHATRSFIICFVILITVLGYGVFRLNQKIEGENLRISVIQGNIPQELKWDPGAKDWTVDRYLNLTRQAGEDNPDLVIWPEATLPAVLEEEPAFYERIKDFVREIKIPILLGAATSKDTEISAYYNSALLVSDKGKLLNKYDKLHLVPFGEYIPLRKTFKFLETIVPIGDFAAGNEYTVFALTTHYSLLATKFSVLICFEDLFPGLSRRFVNQGAGFLINITNDAWFKKTSSPYQHLQASVFRAVENRLSLVRAANTGVSGFISAQGEIISLVKDKSGGNIFISGYDTDEIIIAKRRPSFYTQYGDIFILFCLIFSLYGVFFKIRPSVRKI